MSGHDLIKIAYEYSLTNQPQPEMKEGGVLFRPIADEQAPYVLARFVADSMAHMSISDLPEIKQYLERIKDATGMDITSALEVIEWKEEMLSMSNIPAVPTERYSLVGRVAKLISWMRSTP